VHQELRVFTETRGQILGRNWDKSLKSVPPCFLQSPLQTDFNPLTPPPPLEQKLFETGLQVNIVHGNLKSENSQDYAQKPQRNCAFMNSASVITESGKVRYASTVFVKM
jgi:hypothetical protein